MPHTFIRRTLLLSLASLSAQQAAASGYHFGTQSVSAQSTANSSAAEAADASALFYNPAGLAKLDGSQITGAINLVAPSITYHDARATHIGGNRPVVGSNSGKITKDLVVAPHLYGAYQASDRLTLGLGVYVPFASSTDYPRDSVLRYTLNGLGLTSIAVEPAVAFKATEQHSFGVGLIAQHSDAELRKYADWGAAMGLPGAADGYARVRGKDWGFGYHAGWLFDAGERLRLGVNYRSKITHTLKGQARWHADSPAAARRSALAAMGYPAEEAASVRIVTPESLSLHGLYRANDKLKLFADFTWTRHSRFNKAVLQFEQAKVVGQTARTGRRSNQTTLTPDWRDTVKIGFGGAYQVSQPLQLRAGIAFDQSPVKHAGVRMNTLPDGNRIWFSLGAKYAFNPKHSLDLAYTHVHINDTEFRSPSADGSEVDSKGPASAKFKNHANIVGLQYTYRF